eukprot:768575-Hanusia_phi.AAC.8
MPLLWGALKNKSMGDTQSSASGKPRPSCRTLGAIVAPSEPHVIVTSTLSLYGPALSGLITGSSTCGCTTMSPDLVSKLSPMSGDLIAIALTV